MVWKEYEHKYDPSIVYLARQRDDGDWEMKRYEGDEVTTLNDFSFRMSYVEKEG